MSGLEGEGQMVTLGGEGLPTGAPQVPPHILPASEGDLLYLALCGETRRGLDTAEECGGAQEGLWSGLRIMKGSRNGSDS